MKFYSKQIHSSTSRHAQPPAPARDKTTPTPIYHIPHADRLSFFGPPYFALRVSIRAFVSPYFAHWAQYGRLCRPISPYGSQYGLWAPAIALWAIRLRGRAMCSLRCAHTPCHGAPAARRASAAWPRLCELAHR